MPVGPGAPQASGTLGFLAVGRVIASGGRREAVNLDWCGFSGCLLHPTHGKPAATTPGPVGRGGEGKGHRCVIDG